MTWWTGSWEIALYGGVLAGVLGAVLGSFLNCAAGRMARGESFLRGRSHCMSCGHELGARDLIPVVSWVLSRGRCRYCGEKVSARYPLTELAFGAITLACLLRFDLTVLGLRNWAFLGCLFCLALVDWESRIIPDGCHVFNLAVWVLALPFLGWSWQQIGLRVLAGVIFGGGLLGISLVMDKLLGRDSLGGGDIKLVAVIGLYLGAVGTLFTVILACVLGLLLAAARRGSEEKSIPFGPALAAAAGTMLLFGQGPVEWYKALLGVG